MHVQLGRRTRKDGHGQTKTDTRRDGQTKGGAENKNKTAKRL